MALPQKIKHINLFNDGNMYLAQVTSFTPATLTRKLEAYRGGGMSGSVKVDHGLDDDALKVSFVIGGHEQQALKQMGGLPDAVPLRFMGSLQDESTGQYKSLEIVVRGRIMDREPGEYKTGEDSSTTINMACTYYKEVLDGEVLVEIDLMNMVEIFGGVDRLERARKAIGL